MEGGKRGLGLLVWIWCLHWSDAMGLWDGSADLHCGVDSMELSFPLSIDGAAFSLSVLDFQGEPHILANNSACGFWISKKLNGRMLISAAYDGCYITEEGRDYVLTLVLEEIVNGEVDQYKVEKRCPVTTVANDAPSTSQCSAVSEEDKLLCVQAPVSQDVCEGAGCCYSSDPSMPCYYGNSLTTQCTSGNNMVVVVSKNLTIPSLNFSSVYVVGVNSSTCAGYSMVMSASFAIFQFPLSCAVSRQVPGGPLVYESSIRAVRTVFSWKGSTITRDSAMRLTVRCSYPQTEMVTVQFGVSTLPPPKPVATSGPLLMEMRIAQDMTYSTYFSAFPVVKLLRDPVYLEVRILNRTDPDLMLVLNDCWATNSADSTRIPQWPILLNRCPFDGDNYISQTIPVGNPTQSLPYPSHYQRFVVNTFTFVDPSTEIALGGLVYFHCSASACVPSAIDNCMTSCTPRNKRMAEDHKPEPLKDVVTSNGPVEFLPFGKEALKLEGHLHTEYSTLDVVRAIAAGGVVASVFLMSLVMWLHCRNASKKLELNA